MERQRGTSIAIVAALIIAVISLGVAFAAFSTTLNINGTATVQASSWDIYWTNDGTNYSKPTSSQTLVAGTDFTESNSQSGITETVTASGSVVATTLTWSATFKTPGDQVVYTIHVNNGGSYAAKVTNVNLPQVTCKSGDPLTTETAVCAHIHYGLYTDSTCETAVSTSSPTIAAGGHATYYLKAWLDNTGWTTDGTSATGTPLPTVNVVSDSISATVTYGQVTSN
jgi:hypothetical protein